MYPQESLTEYMESKLFQRRKELQNRSFYIPSRERSFIDSVASTNASYLANQSLFAANPKDLFAVPEYVSNPPHKPKRINKTKQQTSKNAINKSFSHSRSNLKTNQCKRIAVKPLKAQKMTVKLRKENVTLKENLSMCVNRNVDTSLFIPETSLAKMNMNTSCLKFPIKTGVEDCESIKEKIRVSKAKLLESDLKLQLAQRDQVKTKFMLCSVLKELGINKPPPVTQNDELLQDLCSLLSSRLKHKS